MLFGFGFVIKSTSQLEDLRAVRDETESNDRLQTDPSLTCLLSLSDKNKLGLGEELVLTRVALRAIAVCFVICFPLCKKLMEVGPARKNGSTSASRTTIVSYLLVL